ncbi:hypothetical protein ACU61A_26040 [Pseudonocardia sichuanensis]
MRVDYRAAWVPFDPDNGQTPALLELAVDWIEQECAAQGTRGVLIVPRKPISDYPQPIQKFATRHEGTSRRGSAPRRMAPGPVLAHSLLLDDLDYAEHLARGSSLCATEWPDVPLVGWAAARGALNLVTGEVTPQPADDVVVLLNHLHFAGNNGWSDGPGRRDAERLLHELQAAAPDLDARYVASYQFGLGNVSADSVKRLLTLASKVTMR